MNNKLRLTLLNIALLIVPFLTFGLICVGVIAILIWTNASDLWTMIGSICMASFGGFCAGAVVGEINRLIEKAEK